MKTTTASLCTAALLALSAAPFGTALAADNRVVMQVSDNDEGKWNLALNNAKNLQSAFGKGNVDIEIVVYGPGIGMLKAESTVGNRIADAGAAGVKVVACENTMKAQKLARADMLDTIAYVPGGVVEIMERQKEGWAYIRP
jgi:intracellular sulfur oxidation DsrE/DsrF family protein